MKNGEILEFAAIFLLVALVLYRKYGKKYNKKGKSGGEDEVRKKGSVYSARDDYEPYSNKEE